MPKVPTEDYLRHIDLGEMGQIGEAIESLIYDLENGYFLTWEAVVRQEQGLPLSEEQEAALDDLISFNDDGDDEPILYINERSRPSEPWYEIVRTLVPHLLLEEFKTYEVHYEVTTEGWPRLANCLKVYGSMLSLPEGIESPLDVIASEIQHRLWLQYCFGILSGLGQAEELTLAREEQHYRIEHFIKRLKEHKESVEYLDLTLEKMLKLVLLPPKDEEIFVDDVMLKELGISSVKEPLGNAL